MKKWVYFATLKLVGLLLWQCLKFCFTVVGVFWHFFGGYVLEPELNEGQ
jgi:hypothetical protein